MDQKVFDEPRVAINRVYTRSGDRGDTGLAGGQRIPKDSLRIEAYGTVDELNAFVGLACVSAEELAISNPALLRLSAILNRVQHELFNLGSILATKTEDVHPKQARVTAVEIQQLENEIDELNSDLPALRSFVLPGGHRLNPELHVCRTVCRRAERLCVALAREEQIAPETIPYLNRLGDAFFVLSRWASYTLGIAETLWQPNRAASAQTATESAGPE